ncbi:polyprenyl synthetase family protein [Tsuneonella mangrovi]|uniref:polyprenyl synthetase family protein n=1 Tax=Tsuneonella mangrovi TaxID=1982042 RepID=UPI000BA2658A|nr:polyprenyl synthetase family protein [Tsuneonella mangrovi]
MEEGATSAESAAGCLPAGLLDRYASATRGELTRYLTNPSVAPFLDDLLADYPGRGGKMMRPAICIANARLFGGELQSVVRCAAAVELLHNALLIHDDIQDGSEERRGRPTLHALHGVPLAINAGDALMFTAFRPLLDAVRPCGPEVARQVIDATIEMARQTAEGQALELGWRDNNVTGLTTADYLRMALKKTAWMGMIWPAQLGAIVGSRGRVDPARLMGFGHFLGIAFQIEDDLRNLTADPGYGKERGGDLFEGKRTLMLIHVREAASAAERKRIDAFLACDRGERGRADGQWLAELMHEKGSIAYGKRVAAAMAGCALEEFDQAYGECPEGEDRDFLLGLVRWIFDRK